MKLSRKRKKLWHLTETILKNCSANGKLIEAGWIELQLTAIAKDAPDPQVRELRKAFFAGAHHLFLSILNVLERGNEPTETDFRRMKAIQKELDEFVRALKADHGL